MAALALAALLFASLEPEHAPSPRSEPESESEPAQLDEQALSYHRARTRLSFASGGILTGWGLANIGVGIAGNLSSEGRLRYFHQGNWAWNTVNVALGVAGLAGAARARKQPVALSAGYQAARKAQLAFAINAALDVVYVSSGAVMWHLTLGQDTAAAQRIGGYGEALVLQGSFLFAFDVAMLWAHEILLERSERAQHFAARPSVRGRPEGGFELGLALAF